MAAPSTPAPPPKPEPIHPYMQSSKILLPQPPTWTTFAEFPTYQNGTPPSTTWAAKLPPGALEAFSQMISAAVRRHVRIEEKLYARVVQIRVLDVGAPQRQQRLAFLVLTSDIFCDGWDKVVQDAAAWLHSKGCPAREADVRLMADTRYLKQHERKPRVPMLECPTISYIMEAENPDLCDLITFPFHGAMERAIENQMRHCFDNVAMASVIYIRELSEDWPNLLRIAVVTPFSHHRAWSIFKTNLSYWFAKHEVTTEVWIWQDTDCLCDGPWRQAFVSQCVRSEKDVDEARDNHAEELNQTDMTAHLCTPAYNRKLQSL